MPFRPVVSAALLAAFSWPVGAQPALVFPGLLAKEAREAGNPLATLAAMEELESQYLDSKIFATIYPEVKLNYEQFLGVPDAGLRAMQLPALRSRVTKPGPSVLDSLEARAAIDVVCRHAATTRIVVWGEEHHLPQTRSLYESLLRRLRGLGYEYLAAETFTDSVMADGFTTPDYHSGFYLLDPVYASAVRTATSLGYRLVAYDTSKRGPAGDGSFRDRTQAENIIARVFDQDPNAKVLILAGRSHAAETVPVDGWTPMASVLKRRLDIDPFTIYAPTMSERLERSDEHPLYRAAADQGLVAVPTIFVDRDDEKPLGAFGFDAYVFWPRVTVRDGRPDWLRTALGRSDVPIPEQLSNGDRPRLVQVFAEGESETVIPIDQVLLRPKEPTPALVLPAGKFWARSVDTEGRVRGPHSIEVAPQRDPSVR